ncbi:hypothetical protein IMSAG049_01031 [Clostridiales bacterium]|nr:hypothetical protein IMSAG049_01031 [Clostridiales bacterium]
MIYLINGSPKGKNSVSKLILNNLKKYFPENKSITEIELFSVDTSGIKEMDILVFAFPLYVDGLPSNVLAWLEQADIAKVVVYAICNCGFYEGSQCKTTLSIMSNWCERKGLAWKRGLGIGGGPAIAMTNSIGEKGPNKSVCAALRSLAEDIVNSADGENIYTQISVPRVFYKMGGEMMWKKMAKENGLKPNELNRKI